MKEEQKSKTSINGNIITLTFPFNKKRIDALKLINFKYNSISKSWSKEIKDKKDIEVLKYLGFQTKNIKNSWIVL